MRRFATRDRNFAACTIFPPPRPRPPRMQSTYIHICIQGQPQQRGAHLLPPLQWAPPLPCTLQGAGSTPGGRTLPFFSVLACALVLHAAAAAVGAAGGHPHPGHPVAGPPGLAPAATGPGHMPPRHPACGLLSPPLVWTPSTPPDPLSVSMSLHPLCVCVSLSPPLPVSAFVPLTLFASVCLCLCASYPLCLCVPVFVSSILLVSVSAWPPSLKDRVGARVGAVCVRLGIALHPPVSVSVPSSRRQ